MASLQQSCEPLVAPRAFLTECKPNSDFNPVRSHSCADKFPTAGYSQRGEQISDCSCSDAGSTRSTRESEEDEAPIVVWPDTDEEIFEYQADAPLPPQWGLGPQRFPLSLCAIIPEPMAPAPPAPPVLPVLPACAQQSLPNIPQLHSSHGHLWAVPWPRPQLRDGTSLLNINSSYIENMPASRNEQESHVECHRRLAPGSPLSLINVPAKKYQNARVGPFPDGDREGSRAEAEKSTPVAQAIRTGVLALQKARAMMPEVDMQPKLGS